MGKAVAVVAGRLLLIEDDETIGEVLTSSLHAHGHEVLCEQTGHGGLNRAADAEFDLVLIDLGLPDLDGVEVCRRVRAAQPGTVLVMLTARSAMDTTTSARRNRVGPEAAPSVEVDVGARRCAPTTAGL